jgi:hypothetical protein
MPDRMNIDLALFNPLARASMPCMYSCDEERRQRRNQLCLTPSKLGVSGRTTEIATPRENPKMLYFYFLSILSIKCGNWFYWADRAERADRAESKESSVFMRI